VTLHHRHPTHRRHARPRAAALFVLACACLAAAGCARTVSLAEIGSTGAPVWVRLSISDGEELVGQVVSLDAVTMVVATRHRLVGDVRVRTRGGEEALYDGAERMPGEVARIEREEDRRYAVVHRTFRALEIESATFHESGGERSLASIISHLLGPVVGAALGFVL
jgi:hypothetical protein